jgi:hypothetical protein
MAKTPTGCLQPIWMGSYGLAPWMPVQTSIPKNHRKPGFSRRQMWAIWPGNVELFLLCHNYHYEVAGILFAGKRLWLPG